MKAIRITDGHAEVVEERCIADGKCVTICPQHAKKVESAIPVVKDFLASRLPVGASIAPSFVAAFGSESVGSFIAALKKLGFAYVEETAEGAEWVALAHQKLVKAGKGPVLTSCCPAIVNLIKVYYPQLLPYLAPVVSPMVAHGRIMKKRYGAETKIVFIGPCIAKKGEIEEELPGIDAVLTFTELQEMLDEEHIDLAVLEEEIFDGDRAISAHAFASPGGLARSAMLSTDLLSDQVVTIDGLEETIEFLNRFAEIKDSLKLVELLACRGGCVMGPGMAGEAPVFARRNRLISYAGQRLRARGFTESAFPSITDLKPTGYIEPKLNRVYQNCGNQGISPSEDQIKQVLAKTGKFTPEDELNCGACGYNSCREKAVAVLNNMAEIDMCIPFMRARAESRANLVLKFTPNAIFVVDSDLKILEVNPAAEEMFQCRQNRVLGQKLSTIMNPKHFEVALNEQGIVTGEVSFPSYGIIAWQAIFYVKKEDVLIGIFADLTEEKQQRERLALVTGETLEKAQEVIDKQMRVAQEIAGLLGETTAETKVLLTKLIKLFQNEDGKT
ncbi:MAG TPA: PAS domain-containing protein [Firmicutes bacterium]|nr:PAS domain-containing protein [Bacillota bacterium]